MKKHLISAGEKYHSVTADLYQCGRRNGRENMLWRRKPLRRKTKAHYLGENKENIDITTYPRYNRRKRLFNIFEIKLTALPERRK